MGIETVNIPCRGGDRDKILLQREAYWVHCLDILIPNGLNKEISFSCFLWSLTTVVRVEATCLPSYSSMLLYIFSSSLADCYCNCEGCCWTPPSGMKLLLCFGHVWLVTPGNQLLILPTHTEEGRLARNVR